MATAQQTKSGSHRYIEDLKPGESFEDQVYMVAQKDLRTTSRGDLYVHMVFVDRTGQVVARIWQASQAQYNMIPEGGFLGFRGRVESYKGSLQVIVEAIRPANPEDLELSDFLPRTRFDQEEMWDRLLEILRTIEHPKVLALISAFIKDEVIASAFKNAPAAIQNHHAYIGGLLEHTCSLLELATRILGLTDDSQSHYPALSRDLVLAGIFLHDIGKITELGYETNFVYSTEGQLVGHITQAALLIDRKAAKVAEESGEPFPDDLRNLLTHIVLSHHGTYEFGSPKIPSCPEAILVHYLDNIDAKLNMAFAEMDDDRSGDDDWTGYNRALATRVFRKDILGCRRSTSP